MHFDPDAKLDPSQVVDARKQAINGLRQRNRRRGGELPTGMLSKAEDDLSSAPRKPYRRYYLYQGGQWRFRGGAANRGLRPAEPRTMKFL